MRSFHRTAVSVFMAALAAVAVLAGPLSAAAQGTPGGGLGRPYVHVFLAYVVAWLLVLGWIVSIARRLARVEKRLDGS